jgi:hypothetical protein
MILLFNRIVKNLPPWADFFPELITDYYILIFDTDLRDISLHAVRFDIIP